MFVQVELLATTSLEKRLLAINKSLEHINAQKRRSEAEVCMQPCEGLQSCQTLECCQHRGGATTSSQLVTDSIIILDDDDDTANNEAVSAMNSHLV